MIFQTLLDEPLGMLKTPLSFIFEAFLRVCFISLGGAPENDLQGNQFSEIRNNFTVNILGN